MNDIFKDPIIENYIRLSRCSQTGTEMPLFSETLLRVAFKQIFGKFRRLEQHELSMYRKLILFYYSEDYPQIKDLLSIMNCFTEDEINSAVSECNAVIKEWRKFTQEHLYIDAQKQTFIKILEEWSRRHQRLHGAVSKQQLEDKAEQLSLQINWNLNVMKRCLNKMRTTLLKATPQTERFPKNLVKEDLEFNNIIRDILPKINPLLREKLMHKTHKKTEHTNDSDDDDDDNEYLASKKLRLERIEILPKSEDINEIDNVSKKVTAATKYTANVPLSKAKAKPIIGYKKIIKTKPLVEVINVANIHPAFSKQIQTTQRGVAAAAAVKIPAKSLLKLTTKAKQIEQEKLSLRKQQQQQEQEAQVRKQKAARVKEEKLKKLKEEQEHKKNLEKQQRQQLLQVNNNNDDNYDEDGTVEILEILSDSDNEYQVSYKSLIVENDEKSRLMGARKNSITTRNFQNSSEVFDLDNQADEVQELQEDQEETNANGIKINLFKVDDYVESLPIDIIDLGTAVKHLSELQTFALINGQFEANELLHRVNNLLTKNTQMQNIMDN